ncbi:type I polyketide synthase [Paracoccus luteus]|uniref:type I polyketide synthase n=1 Tax=Paracoccus luteus TaxID=2508543 RepID=UPI001070554F|nr:type I polyketide synthase [Paracoccus luteus]
MQDHAVCATDVAIIGMALQVPGAQSLPQFWSNLCDGIESIRRIPRETLLARGEPAARLADPNYVPAAAELEEFDGFDAEFFGLNPKEAAIMDPQHRKLLETCWHAFDDAGIDPARFAGPVGVFAGCGQGTYYWQHVLSNRDLVDGVGHFLLRHTGNDKDFLATRVSHILNLTGPSVNVQTACSTSLVAVHQACNALLGGECDLALAGGVTIEMPHGVGYLFRENEVLSPDGHCHAFDHRAQGTVFGSGAAVVVLRRLSDAIAAGDAIHAVIKGTAINNDGSGKAGYLAPSVGGQSRAIAEALAVSGCDPATVGYVECHGTGTALGDPIEVAALTAAFQMAGGDGERAAPCRLGSVKTNIGHLDTAAGTAGLIKAALVVENGEIPPTLGFERENPAIDFASSPFRVADRRMDWPELGAPRRAGVNSLGVGGTNAHVVIQQPPPAPAAADAVWPWHPLVVSGRSKAALDANAAALADWLDANPDADVADVAHTLAGRHVFDRRRVLVAGTPAEAAALLRDPDPRQVFDHRPLGEPPRVVFMLPGGGAQHAGMARDLYATEPVFRDWMDRGLAHLQTLTGTDPRAIWLPQPGHEEAAERALRQPSVQLPLLMIVEYALAQTLIGWGVRPDALIGHSMGENTAACLAGVMRFQDCIGLVHLRGTLFDAVPPGGMVSVPLPPEDFASDLGPDLDLAALNGPGLSVVSGPRAALDAFAARMAAREVEVQDIPIAIAAHSRMLDGILDRFGAYLRSIPLSAPQIDIISNRTGKPLTAAEATDPAYWVAHLRGTVRFGDGIAHLAAPDTLFIEVGPGRATSAMVKINPAVAAHQVVSVLRHAQHDTPDDRYLLGALARIDAAGVAVDWADLWGGAARKRLRLPGYSFQRRRYFIEAEAPTAAPVDAALDRIADMADWGWRPGWQLSAPAVELDATGAPLFAAPQNWLILSDAAGLGDRVAAALTAAGQRVALVRPGDRFAETAPGRWVMPPESDRDGFGLMFAAVEAAGLRPDHILHLGTLDSSARAGLSALDAMLDRGFYSLLHLAQGIESELPDHPLTLTVVTDGALRVAAEPAPAPELATVAGPLAVLPRELGSVRTRWIDLRRDADSPARLVEELASPPEGPAMDTIALRGARRWRQVLRPVALPQAAPELPDRPVVLITGGFGGIGQALARGLAARGARLVLTTRGAVSGDSPAARRIAAMTAALGPDALAFSADPTDAGALRAAAAEARRRHGRLDLVIHAAGTVDDALIASKTDAAAADVLAPKLYGARALMAALADAPPAMTVLFSSSSTAIAAAGQADYVAANAWLDALAAAQPPALGRTVALNWGVWADTGMAARALGLAAVTGGATDAALLTVAGPSGAIAELDAAHWLVDGHRTAQGQALLPGTGIAELMLEALAAAGHRAPVALADLRFLRPALVADGAATRLSVRIEPDGLIAVDDGAGDGPNATARLAQAARPAPSAVPDTGRWDAADPAGMASAQEGQMRFGPEWRVLRARRIDAQGGTARLSLDPRFDTAGMVLHPGLFDIATGWAMALIPGYDPAALWVPTGYDALTVHAPLGSETVSRVTLARASEDEAAFDVQLFANGHLAVDLRGLSLRRMAQGLPAAARPHRSAPEERLRRAVAAGITAAEGVQAFDRALALAQRQGLSQVHVSPLDLPALVAQAGQRDDRAAGQTFERPDIEGEFIAPAPGTQADLAAIWAELLGIRQIGATDSFFDLGGHSLIAVRLFGQIRKQLGADLPISALIEAPTVAELAARIEQQTGPRAAAAPGAPAVATAAAPARRFVVPMGGLAPEQGGGTPLFMVAGMFGNVMNLRPLAQRLGTARQFYGLQARGLFGGEPPHETFAEAARDYLDEITQVQPDGPYLLAGFSGGGLIALEIARELERRGQGVAHLVMLDTPLPMRASLTRRDRLAIRWGEIREQGTGFLGKWLADKRAYRASLAARAADAGPDQTSFHDRTIEAAFYAALPRMELARWDGPVTLFRPPLDRRWRVGGGRWVTEAREYLLEDNGWGDWMARLTVSEVPGDHDSMVLEPNVRVLAARLGRTLAAADTGAGMSQAAE